MKWVKTKFLLVFSAFFILSACGITQELDEALVASENLTKTLDKQKEQLSELGKLVDKIQSSFDKDLEKEAKTGLFKNQEGLLYKNFQARQSILSELKTGQKKILKTKNEFQRISDKHAVDIDNDKLRLISSSLEIIDNNYDALIRYMTTGFEQEEDFYTDLPVDNIDDQLSIINRTYGSVTMVLEEALTNINYTDNLVNSFISQAKNESK